MSLETGSPGWEARHKSTSMTFGSTRVLGTVLGHGVEAGPDSTRPYAEVAVHDLLLIQIAA